MRPAHWLPPVLWMALILVFSSDVGSAAHTRGLFVRIVTALMPWATPPQLEAMHTLARKGAHVGEYAILAILWFRALSRGSGLGPRAASWVALGIALGWAGLDELLQSWRPSRTGSALDVVIDAAGTVGGLVVARVGWRAVSEGTTVILLWAAAVGGATALAANALADVRSGALWLTTPVAILALLLRRRRRPLPPDAPPGPRESQLR